MRPHRAVFIVLCAVAVMLAGCGSSRLAEPVAVVAEFCENSPFLETDLAVRWQIPYLPSAVADALLALRSAGSKEHTRYLCHLLLREYDKQLEQFRNGYTLGPALPREVIQEIDRLFQEAGYLKPGRDYTSSDYADVVMCHPELIADYAKAQDLAKKITRKPGAPPEWGRLVPGKPGAAAQVFP